MRLLLRLNRKFLCNFLKIENTNELNEIVNTQLNITKMKKVSDELGTFAKFDNNLSTAFCIHGNHIESTEVLSWRDRVDESILDELNNLYKSTIIELGYDI